MIKMPKTVEMNLSDIHEPDYNANEMSNEEYEKLKHNIKTEGYLELIVVNEQTNFTIVSGSHRKRALLEFGVTKAPVIVIDVPLEREKALSLAFNRIGGVLNQEKVAQIIHELEQTGFDEFELTGLSDFEFDMAFAEFEEDEYAHEFDDIDLKFQTENEEKRGSPRPEREKKERKKKIIKCPHCGEEIEV